MCDLSSHMTKQGAPCFALSQPAKDRKTAIYCCPRHCIILIAIYTKGPATRGAVSCRLMCMLKWVRWVLLWWKFHLAVIWRPIHFSVSQIQVCKSPPERTVYSSVMISLFCRAGKDLKNSSVCHLGRVVTLVILFNWVKPFYVLTHWPNSPTWKEISAIFTDSGLMLWLLCCWFPLYVHFVAATPLFIPSTLNAIHEWQLAV